MDVTRDLFAQRGLRCTDQRVAIYETLRASKSHPTADELFRQVKPMIGHLSLATVYNTLEAFFQAGLCRKLPTTSGSIRYDADTSEHLHIRYRDTGRIDDVPEDLGRRLLRRLPREAIEDIELALGVQIDGVSIQLTATRATTRTSDASRATASVRAT